MLEVVGVTVMSVVTLAVALDDGLVVSVVVRCMD